MKRAGHGLAKLAAALRRPSSPPPQPPHRGNVACPAVLVLVPWFVLVGRDGQVIRPRIPTGGCDQPQQQVLTALRKLPWVTVSTRLVQQTETQPEATSGCAPGLKDMFNKAYGYVTHPAGGGPVFPSQPKSLLVCVFRVSSGSQVGKFVRGGRLSGPAEAELLHDIAAGRNSAGCPRQHTEFATLQEARHLGSPVAYVALDGCRRVLRPDRSIGQASPAAITIIDRVG